MTIIDTCAGLTDSACGLLVKTTCSVNPASCGIYYQVFTQEVVNSVILYAVTVFCIAWGWRMIVSPFMSRL
ncbi:MAG: hypothetical protein ACI9VI_003535 [Candidatus Azotimanducaceae bacterium]|jgi:hypothetical protein